MEIEKNITLNVDILQYIIVVAGYIVAICTSGLIVRHFVGNSAPELPNDNPKTPVSRTGYDVGVIIGKCENFLVITLILVNAFAGLALIFTAKSIVRSDDIKKNPKYYLGGTLVNFSYSVLMGFVIRILLNALGHPI